MDPQTQPPPGVTLVPMPGAAQSSTPAGPPPGVSFVSMPEADNQTPTSTIPDGEESYFDAVKRRIQPASIMSRVKGLGEGLRQGMDSLILPIADQVHKIPGGIGEHFAPQAGLDREHAFMSQAAPADQEEAGGQSIGNDIESLLEFVSGDKLATEGLKALSLPEKLKQAGELGKMLEKFPGLARVLGTGARQGGVAAALTGAHGGTAADAAQAALLTGGTGAAFEAIPAAASAITKKVAPGTRTIAGANIPLLASQEPDAGAAARHAAQIQDEPEFQEAQQVGARQAIGNIAQDATRGSIQRLNATRERPLPESDPSKLLPAPRDMAPFRFSVPGGTPLEDVDGTMVKPARKKQIDTRVVAGKGSGTLPNEDYNASSFQYGDGEPLPQVSDLGNQPEGSHKEPVWQYLTDTKPGSGEAASDFVHGPGTLLTTDPAAAQHALTRLQDLTEQTSFADLSDTQQAKIHEAIGGLQSQLDEHGAYRASMSHFEQIDPERTAAQVGDFRTAAAQIQNAAAPVYSKLDEISNGKWGGLRKSEQAARKVLNNPTSIDAYDRAGDRLAEIRQQMGDLLQENREKISEPEWRAANAAWKDASTLDDIHTALQSSFNGVPQEVAQQTGIKRTMKGGEPTFKRLQKLLDSRGDDVKRVIGQEGINNLYRVADLLKTPEDAANTNQLLKAVGAVMRRHGVGVGAMVGGAIGHGVGGVVGHAFGGYEGALAGAGAEAVYRKIINRVATDPKVAQRVQYAVKNHVSNRVAAPIVATMILGQVKDDQKNREAQK